MSISGPFSKGWVEIFSGRVPVVIADNFSKTTMSTGETETYSGVRISEADAQAIAAVPDLIEALCTIAGGHTNRFPGAPDAMSWTGSPADFRSAMWTWSQSVAKAALTKAGVTL